MTAELVEEKFIRRSQSAATVVGRLLPDANSQTIGVSQKRPTNAAFTDYYRPFAVPVCSLQAVRSLSRGL
jgi:hypothetical protein